MFSDLLQEGGLSLDRLQSFCLVAEAGGVTKAAQGDPARQSLFSRQIKELQEFFGVDLVRRDGRGTALTAAGKRLHVIAREYFAALSDFKSEFKGRPVELTVGAGDSLIQWLLLPRLARAREKLPAVRMKFLNLTNTEIINRLADGRVDFGIVRKGSMTAGLRGQSLGTMSYSLFVPSEMRPKTGAPSRDLLKRLPLATLEGEGNFRRELAEAARVNRITLSAEVECSSFPLVARALHAGKLAAILPSIASTEFDSRILELRVPFLNRFGREVFLAWNPRFARIRSSVDKAAKVLGGEWKF